MKKMLMTVLALCLLINVSGCTSRNEKVNLDANNSSYAIAVVVGANANSYRPSTQNAAIRDAIFKTVWTYGDVSVIQADGAPKAVLTVKIPEPTVEGLSNDKLKGIANGYTDQILAALNAVRSETEEIDYYKAIALAGQFLRASNAENKTLFILASLCGTKGYFDCTRGLLQADSSKLISDMEINKAILNLEGIDVIVSGLGSVAPPQTELSSYEAYNLKEIYNSFFEAGGARSVIFNEELSTNEIYSNLPFVSTFATGDDSVKYKLISRKYDDNSSVRFAGDSDVYINKAQAEKELSSLACELKESGSEVFIVGITAGGVNDKISYELSTARAEKVKETLMNFGVVESQMRILGLASDNQWYVNDRNEDNELIESIASGNRAVLVIDSRSPEAQKLN